MGCKRLFFKHFLGSALCLLAALSPSLASPVKDTKPAFVGSQQDFLKHPLFNSPYKVLANYSPVLGLRAIAESDIYKKKRKASIERTYFNANQKTPYAKSLIYINVKSKGLLGRLVEANGEINYLGHNGIFTKRFDIKYNNEMSFSISKEADMDIKAYLNNDLAMELKVHSKASDMTNEVSGVFLGKATNYKTTWRNSKGTLAGYPYEMFAKGEDYLAIQKTSKDKKEPKFMGAVFESEGFIGGFKVTGKGQETDEDYYELEEQFGPIIVKSIVKVYD